MACWSRCCTCAAFPSETAPDDELNYRKSVRETLLRGAASSRLAIYHHVVRRRVTPRSTGAVRRTASAHGSTRAGASGSPTAASTSTTLFLTLVRRPLQGRRVARTACCGGRRSAGLRSATCAPSTRRARPSPPPWPPTARARCRSTSGHRRRPASEPAEFLSDASTPSVRPMLAPSGDLGPALAARRLNFGLDAMEFAAVGASPCTLRRHDLAEGLSGPLRARHAGRGAAPALGDWCSPRASPSSTARPRSTG